VFNILLDIWVLVLPIRILKDIKRPTRDKIVLFIVFGFGALACIARLVHSRVHPLPSLCRSAVAYHTLYSMVRLYTIRVLSASEDKSYSGTPINIWSMIEINVAMICASVPGKFLSSLPTTHSLTRISSSSETPLLQVGPPTHSKL
jgi:hypothetical protein